FRAIGDFRSYIEAGLFRLPEHLRVYLLDSDPEFPGPGHRVQLQFPLLNGFQHLPLDRRRKIPCDEREPEVEEWTLRGRILEIREGTQMHAFPFRIKEPCLRSGE